MYKYVRYLSLLRFAIEGEDKDKEQRVAQSRPGQSLQDQIDAVRSYFERAAAAQEEKEGEDGECIRVVVLHD